MMRLTPTIWRATVAMFAGVLLAACSTEESLPQIDVDSTAPADETRAGTLLAEYAQPRGGHVGGVSVHAQFLDVRGVNYETALEALEVWSPDWELDVDACNLRTRAGVEQQQREDIRLELLDVGPITVRGPQEAIRLEARRLPDLLSAFSGVIYGTERGFGSQPLRIGYEPKAWYSFDAPGRLQGADASGDFSVAMRAPRPIQIASIAEQTALAGRFFGVDFQDDVALEWQPAGDDTGDDAVFLHISSGFGPDRPRLTCRLDDDGAFVIPSNIIEQLALDAAYPDAAELELSLRRINAQAVDVDGLESAEFILSTVDEITLVDQ